MSYLGQSYKVIKTFNVDGLLIEIIEKQHEASSENQIIKVKDLDQLKPNPNNSCVRKIIENKRDVMNCPSKFIKRDKEIIDEEIRENLDEQNFHVYKINKLLTKLDLLAAKEAIA